jgi:hypothetical protein
MSRLFSKINQRTLKHDVRSVSWIAPLLAISFLRLFNDGSQQCTIMFPCECLPMEIVGASQARFAGTFSASVLMDNDSSQNFDGRRYPNRIAGRINQFALNG